MALTFPIWLRAGHFLTILFVSVPSGAGSTNRNRRTRAKE